MQVEILPQSMVDIKTIVLKPRLDRTEIRSIGETVKPLLFTKFVFKPKPENIRLLASEEYFEPYFIIGGKYVLDYCKRHIIEGKVDKKTTRLFVAGQEFNSKESVPKTSHRVVELTGEEHVHHEKQGYYILDRMNREIPPERLLLSPFVVREKNSELGYIFKRMHISEEAQIDFLKRKIAQRPADVTEIMKEIFDITDRTIAYYPMYLLTFENAKKRKEATVSIDGITGEMTVNGIRNLSVNTILTSREILGSQIGEPVVREEVQPEPPQSSSEVFLVLEKNEVQVSSKEDQTVEFQLPQSVVCKEDHAETVLENVSNISKYENEATLKEGQVPFTQPARQAVCDEVRNEPVLEVVPVAKSSVGFSEKEHAIFESEPTAPIVCGEIHAEFVAEVYPHVTKDCLEKSSIDDHTVQPTQSEETPSSEREQTEPIYILPTDSTKDTLNLPEEEAIQSTQPDENEPTILGFPARILGEVVEIDENVTTVDGDVEIPSGSKMNKNLVVKGSLKIGNNCKGHVNLKTFKDITIGADTIIDGEIISGGNVFVGSRSLINGVVEAAGVFEIEKDAVVEAVTAHTPPLSKSVCSIIDSVGST